MMFCQKEDIDQIDHVLSNHKRARIALCQLNELRERMLIFRRFQSKITYFLQGRPTNLFLTLSVSQRNPSGWQKYRCSDELAGKFIIDRGFACELLTFSSISTRAGC